MKIQIVGSNEKINKQINTIINDLTKQRIEVVFDQVKFNIKYPPAMIIDNVLVDDLAKLTTNELKNVILQFFET